MGEGECTSAAARKYVQLQLPGYPAAAEAGRLSDPSGKSAPVGRLRPAKIGMMAPRRIRFTFAGGPELLATLRRAQEVLKHKYPVGDLDRVFAEALEALLDKKDPDRRLLRKEQQQGPAAPPKPNSVELNPYRRRRYIPLAVRDEVWRRDGGQCVFVGPDRLRCLERGGLEFDHIVPHALGGPSKDPANIRLMCKAHNLLAARRVFGRKAVRGGPG